MGLATVALLVERVWPLAVAVAAVCGLFLTLSWLGLWLIVPTWGRPVGLLLFVALLGAALVWAWRGGWPTRASALARLDRDSALPHRPVSTAEDTLANAASDPATRALWALHRKRLDTLMAGITVRRPAPHVAARDVYAIRAGILVAVVAAAFIAGPEREGRLAAAFAWSNPGHDIDANRIDAWVDAPAYTRRPPLVLLGTEAADGRAPGAVLSAPVGSTVVIRSARDDVPTLTTQGGLKPAPSKADDAGAAGARSYTDQRLTLTADGTLRLTRDGNILRAFTLKAIPDQPPRIAVLDAPKSNFRGSLDLAFHLEDDYGVTGAEARFSAPIVRGKPVTGRSLIDPPHAALTLPALPGGLGDGKTTLDLSDHPWAGAQVTMTLAAHDEGGNTGESPPVTITLPAKPFSKPLAKALVEQRRDLVLDPDDRAGVGMALDALMMAPETFDMPPAEYLGLHTARIRLDAAKTDADLLGVADFLWEMALRIENGDLSKTEQDLRAAQKALKDAIDRGAAPDEIKKLTDALRDQMNKYLAEMMRNADKPGQNEQARQNKNARTVTEKDLQAMIDRMEQAMRNGDTAEAQRLLDQLNNIMENLRTAKRGQNQGQSQATREMNRSMNELDRMMKEQGDVRDKTFQQDTEGGGDDQQADDGSGGQQDQDSNGSDNGQSPSGQGQGKPRMGKNRPGMGALQGRQGTLEQQLQALQRKLQGLGMGGEQGLSDAEQAMKEAEGALGRGDARGAVEAQGRALEGLQRGANGLQQQMAQGGQGEQAQGEGGGQEGESMQQGEDVDPLGRRRQGRGNSQARDLDVSGGLAARAQRVLEELRRRLGDPTRSQEEQDYLERLLKRY